MLDHHEVCNVYQSRQNKRKILPFLCCWTPENFSFPENNFDPALLINFFLRVPNVSISINIITFFGGWLYYFSFKCDHQSMILLLILPLLSRPHLPTVHLFGAEVDCQTLFYLFAVVVYCIVGNSFRRCLRRLTMSVEILPYAFSFL